MSILLNTTMKDVSDALGAADAYYQGTLDLNDLTGDPLNYAAVPIAGTDDATALDGLRFARLTVDQTQSEDDIDDSLTLMNSLRALEKSLPTTVGALLTSTVTNLNTFVLAQTAKTFKVYWDAKTSNTTVAWTDAFRALWRRAKTEELVVRLGTITKSAGTWAAFSADKSISVASKLELRAGSLIGAADITVNATLTKSTGTDLVVVTIPAGTASGTVFSLGSTGYTAATLSCSGGTNSDVVGVWVATS